MGIVFIASQAWEELPLNTSLSSFKYLLKALICPAEYTTLVRCYALTIAFHADQYHLIITLFF